MSREVTLTPLRDYSRQELGVGNPALFLFDEEGRKQDKELMQLSIALRTAEALERQNELLEAQLAPSDERPVRFTLSLAESKQQRFRELVGKFGQDSVLKQFARIVDVRENQYFTVEVATVDDIFYLGMDWEEQRHRQEGGLGDG
ncbi:hypothetical protein [uncultured Hymenobacter sp.]|uniref:hypothetical protein n=1 Tax=uncultured Hymenobacter sp. TaxID=170016 RepID=UPI0035CC78C6